MSRTNTPSHGIAQAVFPILMVALTLFALSFLITPIAEAVEPLFNLGGLSGSGGNLGNLPATPGQ